MQADAEARRIPFRYEQWDDWWAVQQGDFGSDEGPLEGPRGPGGGLLYWQPRPGVFPSGLTCWLGLPLSLYAPAYSAESVYVQESRYGFVVDEFTRHAIPTRRAFYDELFANGTAAGMSMF
eukprot:COSAG04_NODE_9419_length_866_cov_0.898305_1_plen_120_part_10